MAKKNKPELTLEELQAKKGSRQRGWVRFCAIVLAVLLTFGVYFVAAKGEPRVVPLTLPSSQQVVIREQQAPQDTNTPTETPSTPSEGGSTSSGDDSSGGGILDMLMGLLGNIDLSSIAGMLDFEGLGVKVADGIDSLQDTLLGLLDRIQESMTGKPAITHDPVEYGFAGEVGSEEERAEVAKLLNDFTGDLTIANYNYSRASAYTDDGHASIGAQTETLNQILSAGSALGVELSLDSIVGQLAGVGSQSGQMSAPGENDANYLMKATALTADDIQIVSRPNDTATVKTWKIRLKNVDDPNRTEATGLANFTNDYLVQSEVEAAIQKSTSLPSTSVGLLKLSDLEMSYSNIEVTLMYNAVTNQLHSLSYTYTAYGKFTARTNTVQIIGDATTTVTNTYSGFTFSPLAETD